MRNGREIKTNDFKTTKKVVDKDIKKTKKKPSKAKEPIKEEVSEEEIENPYMSFEYCQQREKEQAKKNAVIPEMKTIGKGFYTMKEICAYAKTIKKNY